VGRWQRFCEIRFYEILEWAVLELWTGREVVSITGSPGGLEAGLREVPRVDFERREKEEVVMVGERVGVVVKGQDKLEKSKFVRSEVIASRGK
jgi:hypothetical protein